MLETYSAYVEGLDGAVGRIREVYSECLRGFTLATATVFNRFPHYLVDYIKTIGVKRFSCNLSLSLTKNVGPSRNLMFKDSQCEKFQLRFHSSNAE